MKKIGNAKITPQVIGSKTESLLKFLKRIFNENTNNPEKTIEVIGNISTKVLSGGNKSRKSRKSRKSMKSKTIRKRNYSDYNNKT